jgi:hypothetical protein
MHSIAMMLYIAGRRTLCIPMYLPVCATQNIARRGRKSGFIAPDSARWMALVPPGQPAFLDDIGAMGAPFCCVIPGAPFRVISERLI